MKTHDICIRILTTARVSLMFDAPFFANLAMRMTLNPDNECSDMRACFFDLRYNPEFVRSQTYYIIRNRMKLEILYLLEERMIGRTPRSNVRQGSDSVTQVDDMEVIAAIISAAMAINCAGIPAWILSFVAERATPIGEDDQ